MESLERTVSNIASTIASNQIIISLYMIVVIVFIAMIWYKDYMPQGFSGSFQSAPIAYQGSSSVIGLGTNAKYQVEDSATNRGTSNIWASATGTENLVGGYEAPVFNTVPPVLDNYQYNQGKTMKPVADTTSESFANRKRGAFMESFANPEDKLKNILHGGN